MLFTETVNNLLEYMLSIDRSPRSIEVYGRDLGFVRKYLEQRKNGPVYIEDVAQEDLESFMHYAKVTKNYSANTRSNYFYTLRALYSFAYKKQLVDKNITSTMEFMRVPKIERKYLSLIEIEMIAEGIQSPLIKLMTIFLFNTGLRISECLSLTICRPSQ